MSGNWAFTCKTCNHRYRWTGASNPIPPCPKCHPAPAPVGPQRATPASPRQVDAQAKQAKSITVEIGDSRYDEAQELIASIYETAEEMPDRAADFTESALETVAGIEETIESRQQATQSQIDALTNILAGMQRWIH